MSFIVVSFVLLAGLQTSLSVQKCQNGMFNNQPCASTSRYASTASWTREDGVYCGCGRDKDTAHWWVRTTSVGKVNEAFFEDGSSGFRCGDQCGKCYQLNATGGSVENFKGAPMGTIKTIMIVDSCPRNAADFNWCGQPDVNSTNQYGYSVHFELQNFYKQLESGPEWDHPEVTYKEVDCDTAHYYDKSVPISDRYEECSCSD